MRHTYAEPAYTGDRLDVDDDSSVEIDFVMYYRDDVDPTNDDPEPVVTTLGRDSVAALIGQLQSWLDRTKE